MVGYGSAYFSTFHNIIDIKIPTTNGLYHNDATNLCKQWRIGGYKEAASCTEKQSYGLKASLDGRISSHSTQKTEGGYSSVNDDVINSLRNLYNKSNYSDWDFKLNFYQILFNIFISRLIFRNHITLSNHS
ncbi:hypothetical protein OUZ56_018406 [Daphnia magna]|uniref:Uncharacterized protein n=1 Tax=Daphnia magna TaxID=35525 RepID=A0ABQ9Z8R8_9CRUS|nr:hypothetical protein OUZ56_018406 [Daphnia magna]